MAALKQVGQCEVSGWLRHASQKLLQLQEIIQFYSSATIQDKAWCQNPMATMLRETGVYLHAALCRCRYVPLSSFSQFMSILRMQYYMRLNGDQNVLRR